MRLRVLGVALSAFLVSVSPLGSHAQARPTTQIHGVSLNGVVLAVSSYKPLAGVKIDAFQPVLEEQGFSAEMPAPAQTLTTDADGRFELSALSGAPVSVIFSKFGYQSVRYDIDFAGNNGPVEAAPIFMSRINASALPVCGRLTQPAQSADVYVVCNAAPLAH